MAMAFQWSLVALETLMAEDQMDQHATVLRAFSVVELWRLRRVCHAFHRWGTAALAALPRIVAVGGSDADHMLTAAVEVMDLSTLRWSSGVLPDMSEPRRYPACCFGNGRLVVVGGNGFPRPRHPTLSQTAVQWVRGAPGWAPLPLPNTPTQRNGAVAVALLDGRTMVIGGQDIDEDAIEEPEEGPSHATVDVLAADGSGWTVTAPISAARIDPMATVLPCGKVLVAGGEASWAFDLEEELWNQTGLKTAELWDPATGEWSALPPMPHASFDAACCVLPSGRVAVVGGFDKGGNMRPVAWEAFDLETRAWEAMPPMPRERSCHAAVPVPGGFIVVGGGVPSDGDGTDLEATDWLFDEKSGRWFDLPHLMVQPRWSPGVVPLPAAALAPAPAP